MCLLSVYSPGAPVNVEHLENGAMCNPHGYGFAVLVPAVDGQPARIEVGHGMDACATIDAFERVRLLHPAGPALFHSRYTTDGTTTVDNCHPFPVGGDPRTVLAHNGVLPVRPGVGDDRSDTRITAEDLIPSGRFGNIATRRGRKRLTKWAGGYNKIAILTVDPRFRESLYILNESAGTWVQGVWHSNDGYLPSRYTPLSRWDAWDTPAAPASESSAAWEAYLNGELTLSEYVTAMRTGTDPTTCPICFQSGSVNLTVGYCRECNYCVDCFEHAEDCQCFPARDSAIVRDIMGGEKAMALESITDTGTELC